MASGYCSILKAQIDDRVEPPLATATQYKPTMTEPEYPGGQDAFYKYIIQNVRYPRDARLGKKEGTMHMRFVIDKDGKIIDVKAINAISTSIVVEITSVLNGAESFSPATQHGLPVGVQVKMPFTFTLDPERVNPDGSPFGFVSLEEMTFDQGQIKVDATYEKGTWWGTIYDPEGNSLVGATIVVEGTTDGTMSDRDGNFILKANPLNDLWITFVGYEGARLTLH